MHITHINFSDLRGGASRAAYRLHQSLLLNGLKSTMRVIEKISQDQTVVGGEPLTSNQIGRRILRRIGRLKMRNFKSDNQVLHSSAWPSTGLGKELQKTSSDIVHLHWICNNTISIEEIGKLNRPIVWTLHDMWPFCGAEHYTDANEESRFRLGYNANNIPLSEKNDDLNRRVWLRKKENWKIPMHIVCPSNWMAQCARSSILMRDWPVYVIPNPINTDIWRPLPKSLARQVLGLPEDALIVLTGSDSGLSDPRKGTRLAIQALTHISKKENIPDILLVLGQSEKSTSLNSLKIKLHFLGHLADDISLILTYSAVDVVLVPSKQDNLPNIAVEAQACGTPVVAFNIGGLPDIVSHKITGWLAKPFEVEDFANGISWVLGNTERLISLSQQSRKQAVSRFAPANAVERYQIVYNSAIKQ